MKKKLVVLTGAGISKESGLDTFRDEDGIWMKHDYNKIGTALAWKNNPDLVLNFHNKLREEIEKVQPNRAHTNLTLLEKDYDVTIITQNVDNLHERAGSTDVIHLHGSIFKMRNSDKSKNYNCFENIKIGDKINNDQLRHDIVLFQEQLNAADLGRSIDLVCHASIFVIIGTSLNVYPVANFFRMIPVDCDGYIIDPNFKFTGNEYKLISEIASVGTDKLLKELL